SGGEQQMLTMCRTLMGDPDLILIDEPTEGLAPKLVEQVGQLLGEIARRGVAILLVEQKLTIALKISQRLYVMGHGRIVFEGTPAALNANDGVRKEWLEVLGAPRARAIGVGGVKRSVPTPFEEYELSTAWARRERAFATRRCYALSTSSCRLRW